MLSARIKALFVLLFATIAIMAVTVKNTPPVSEYMQTGIRLSDLPDLERTEFMVAKGATAVPHNYKTSAGFQELTTDLVARYEENPYRILTGTYGSSSTNLYAEEVHCNRLRFCGHLRRIDLWMCRCIRHAVFYTGFARKW